jgi:hypothetical protein
MKKIALRIIAFLFLPAMLIGLAGCYPDESATIDELDIVLTSYDSSYNFSGIQTYIMPDTVIAITDPDNPSNNRNYDHSLDSMMLSEVAGQFADIGYTRVNDTLVQKPDVGVMLSVVATTYTGAYWSNWYYYWGYYPYWPPYYGYGYGYYYPWTVTYNYSVGTLIVTMIDLKSNLAVTTDSVSLVWMGAVNGLAEGSNVSSRIKSGINQMFKQSPYL